MHEMSYHAKKFINAQTASIKVFWRYWRFSTINDLSSVGKRSRCFPVIIHAYCVVSWSACGVSSGLVIKALDFKSHQMQVCNLSSHHTPPPRYPSVSWDLALVGDGPKPLAVLLGSRLCQINGSRGSTPVSSLLNFWGLPSARTELAKVGGSKGTYHQHTVSVPCPYFSADNIKARS